MQSVLETGLRVAPLCLLAFLIFVLYLAVTGSALLAVQPALAETNTNSDDDAIVVVGSRS
jgi:hypothetical protein